MTKRMTKKRYAKTLSVSNALGTQLVPSMLQPKFLPEQFCNSGVQNVDYQYPPQSSIDDTIATLEKGFPFAQEVLPADGGVPVNRQQFNGILKWLSQIISFMNLGGQFTFNTENSSGYSKGAVLFDFVNSQFLISNKDDNNDNFVTDPGYIGVSWMPVGLTIEELKNIFAQIAGNNAFTGDNNFDKSPTIPNLDVTDNSTKAVNSAFVKAVLTKNSTSSGSSSGGGGFGSIYWTKTPLANGRYVYNLLGVAFGDFNNSSSINLTFNLANIGATPVFPSGVNVYNGAVSMYYATGFTPVGNVIISTSGSNLLRANIFTINGSNVTYSGASMGFNIFFESST